MQIAMAFRQYWFATQNVTWLKSSGFPVIDGIAEYYASRVCRGTLTTPCNPPSTSPNSPPIAPDPRWNSLQMAGLFSVPRQVRLGEDRLYHIANTTGPDEQNTHVADSAYGNSIARISLMAAYELAKAAGDPPNATYKEIANAMFVPYDEEKDYHPEYLGWNESAVGHGISLTKQADTVLMQYPLHVPMNASTARNPPPPRNPSPSCCRARHWFLTLTSTFLR